MLRSLRIEETSDPAAQPARIVHESIKGDRGTVGNTTYEHIKRSHVRVRSAHIRIEHVTFLG